MSRSPELRAWSTGPRGHSWWSARAGRPDSGCGGRACSRIGALMTPAPTRPRTRCPGKQVRRHPPRASSRSCPTSRAGGRPARPLRRKGGAATFYKINPMRLSAGGPVHPGSQVQRLNLRGHLILDDELIPVPAIHRSGLRDLDMAVACHEQCSTSFSWSIDGATRHIRLLFPSVRNLQLERDLSHNLKHLDQVVPRVPSPRTPRRVC